MVAFGIGAADKSAVGGSVSINVTQVTTDAHISQGSVVTAGTTVTQGAVNTVTLRVIFSMGPHKAHQF